MVKESFKNNDRVAELDEDKYDADSFQWDVYTRDPHPRPPFVKLQDKPRPRQISWAEAMERAQHPNDPPAMEDERLTLADRVPLTTAPPGASWGRTELSPAQREAFNRGRERWNAFIATIESRRGNGTARVEVPPPADALPHNNN